VAEVEVEVEIRVSRARCIASKACVNTAPGVFALDDQRVSTVVDPAGEALATVIEAAEMCPTGAISVWKGDQQLA
jgi:ferredoxin